MARSKSSLITTIRNHFRWTEENIDRDDDGNPFSEDEVSITQRKEAKKDKEWERIKDFALRGNAAGAISGLTLLGSKQLASGTPQSLKSLEQPCATPTPFFRTLYFG